MTMMVSNVKESGMALNKTSSDRITFRVGQNQEVDVLTLDHQQMICQLHFQAVIFRSVPRGTPPIEYIPFRYVHAKGITVTGRTTW